MQTLIIRELESNLYFSNKKLEYIFFNKTNDKIRVLAAYTNVFQSAKKSFKEPVKQILHQRIEKKNMLLPKFFDLVNKNL